MVNKEVEAIEVMLDGLPSNCFHSEYKAGVQPCLSHTSKHGQTPLTERSGSGPAPAPAMRARPHQNEREIRGLERRELRPLETDNA